MRIQRFLEHHGVHANPFSEEDAQTDQVFKRHCLTSTYHPAWDKISGDPGDPSTSVVFGEKGAGKTALRLQISQRLADYNSRHPTERVFVIEYDDFNPFLDRFLSRLSPRKRRPDRALAEWKLWDHMDAILSLGVTRLNDALLGTTRQGGPGSDVERQSASPLDRLQKRDLLMLAALYDQSPAENFRQRWTRLRKTLRFGTWRAHADLIAGLCGTAVVLAAFATVAVKSFEWLKNAWLYVVLGVLFAAGWGAWVARFFRRGWQAWRITRQERVVNHEVNRLRQILMQFSADELAGQPLPTKDRSDDRYELLGKFQGILRTLGYPGIFVLVDRVDEPHVINGAVDRMKGLIWPLLDNKFLKHPGVGFKLLLPIELSYYIDREGREFHQRARLDKQNLVPTLNWTGEALYDVANARLAACALDGKEPALRNLFADSISDSRLMEAFRGLRVPRHLFKFLYRLLVAHANACTDSAPQWQISPEMFESILAVYTTEQEAQDRR
jgi:hypothetical protein